MRRVGSSLLSLNLLPSETHSIQRYLGFSPGYDISVVVFYLFGPILLRFRADARFERELCPATHAHLLLARSTAYRTFLFRRQLTRERPFLRRR